MISLRLDYFAPNTRLTGSMEMRKMIMIIILAIIKWQRKLISLGASQVKPAEWLMELQSGASPFITGISALLGRIGKGKSGIKIAFSLFLQNVIFLLKPYSPIHLSPLLTMQPQQHGFHCILCWSLHGVRGHLSHCPTVNPSSHCESTWTCASYISGACLG